MKKLCAQLFFLISVFVLSPIGSNAQLKLAKPESIVYDSSRDRYLISNWDSGDIIEIDSTGNYLLFNGSLASTAGMHILGDTLYVCSNFGIQQGVVGFDLNTKSQLFLIKPTLMEFANSITSDDNGYLYVTDTQTDRVFRINIETQESDVLNGGSIHWPNGIYYNRRLDRLMIASNVIGSPIYRMSLDGIQVLPATITTGAFDGFAEDMSGNFYATYSGEGTVYKFDSSLMNEGEIILSGYNQPEGICYDSIHRILCIPRMFEDLIEFIPFEDDIWATFDTLFSFDPFTVTLSGNSSNSIQEWYWVIGNSDTLTGQEAVYHFSSAGEYSITLHGITDANDTLSRVYRRQIAYINDSIWIAPLEFSPSAGIFEVTVYMSNSIPVRYVTIPLQFKTDAFTLSLASYTQEGCRSEDFEAASLEHYDGFNKRMTFKIGPRPNGAPLFIPVGSGPILKVTFNVSNHAVGESDTILIADYLSYALNSTSEKHSYKPTVIDNAIMCIDNDCCQNNRGNINGDIDDILSIEDLLYFVDYFFAEPVGPAPECELEADVNNDNLVSISDLLYLVDYFFADPSGPPPLACP